MNYRDVYKLFYGEIPKDENGRSYEIHHIDGNRKNNSIFNLVALSIEDHYNVHYIQKDYGACLRIATKMRKAPSEISDLASKQQRNLVDTGRHHFLNGELQSRINYLKVKNGTNPWAGEKGSEQSRKVQKKLLAEGRHHFIGKSNPVYKQLAEGKHPLANHKHEKKTCPKCNKTMTLGNYIRWKHGSDCQKDNP